MANGRFAPSPTGDLHIGNLRTALVAWLCARSTGGRFVLRFEDLDRVTSRPEHQQGQLTDLHAIGLDFDGEPLVQSARFDAHHAAIEALTVAGHTYECFCTRREIAEAVHAPNGLSPSPGYPGTCRSLTDRQRAEHHAAGRRPALRLRGHGTTIVHDRFRGRVELPVDDVVIRRNDGVPAYNLAVVVDDAYQDVEEVVRADDLLSSSAPQARIADLLGVEPVSYVHIPLVVASSGERLAKRDAAVTLADLRAVGVTPAQVRKALDRSIGMSERSGPEHFDLAAVPREPWVFSPDALQ